MTDNDPRTLIVIAAHNEEATVGAVVAQAKSDTGFDVLVVDDASCDLTAGRAREGGAVVLRLPIQLGAWLAMQTGLRYAVKHGYSRVVTMDADGQHLSSFIPPMIVAKRDQCADIMIGSAVERGSPARKIAWKFFRILNDFDIQDLTSGFRIYNRKAIEILASAHAAYFPYQDIGVLLLARHEGLSICETPVEMPPRVNGKSKIFSSWGKVAAYLVTSFIISCSYNKRLNPKACR